MNLALAEMPLPFRFRPETPMTDEELMRFCAANEGLRVERDANGEILVMTPAGSRTGKKNTDVIIDLGIWNRLNGRGVVFESNTGFAGWLHAQSRRSVDRTSPLGRSQRPRSGAFRANLPRLHHRTPLPKRQPS
jgi:Uma2 family endonuclease